MNFREGVGPFCLPIDFRIPPYRQRAWIDFLAYGQQRPNRRGGCLNLNDMPYQPTPNKKGQTSPIQAFETLTEGSPDVAEGNSYFVARLLDPTSATLRNLNIDGPTSTFFNMP